MVLIRSLVVRALCVCVPLCATQPAYAEEVDLFSPNRGAEPVAEAPAKPVSRPKPAKSRPKPKKRGGKPFVLRGTTRIASRYSAVLQTPTGGDVVVRWRSGEVAAVPGFDGYNVSRVAPREVRLTYPEGSECDDKIDLGVRCLSGGRTAILSLVRRSAKAAPKPVQRPAKAGEKKPPAANPFQAALDRARSANPAGSDPGNEELEKKRAAERTARAEKYRNFKPKKINPDEVPAGMKVVHTPFGDRLVPEK